MDKVRELRKRLGLTQPEFAKKLGVGVTTIRRWEAGTVTPLPMAQRLIDEVEKEVASKSS